MNILLLTNMYSALVAEEGDIPNERLIWSLVDMIQLVPSFTLKDLDLMKDEMDHFNDNYDHLSK